MDFDKEFLNDIGHQCPLLYKVIIFFLKKIEDEKEKNTKNMRAIIWLLVFLNIPIWLLVLDVLIRKI